MPMKKQKLLFVINPSFLLIYYQVKQHPYSRWKIYINDRCGWEYHLRKIQQELWNDRRNNLSIPFLLRLASQLKFAFYQSDKKSASLFQPMYHAVESSCDQRPNFHPSELHTSIQFARLFHCEYK